MFNYVVSTGVNLFDTADSYGERMSASLRLKHVHAGRQLMLSTCCTPMTALCMLSRPGHLLCRHGALERPEREAAGQIHQRASRGQQTAGQHCRGHEDCAISLAPHSWAVRQCLQVHYSMNRHGLNQPSFCQCSNAYAVPPHSNPRGGPRQALLTHLSGSELALWTPPYCPFTSAEL